jgi:oxaloacetate decarboxylase alpha subunit
MLPGYEKEIAQYKEMDEDVLTYALFPQVAIDYFKYRQAQETGVDPTQGDAKNKAYPV